MTSSLHGTTKALRAISAAGLIALAGSIFTASTAHAQLPTLPGSKQTVMVDPSQASILVNSPNIAAGQVTGTIFNRTNAQLVCRGLPNPDPTASTNRTPALAATRATTVADAERYYAQFPFAADPVITVDPPVISDINIGLGSIYTLLPAASSGLAWPDAGMRAGIGEAVTDARLSGQFGTIMDITVPPNGTLDYTVPLGPPSAGARQDFEAGVFLACQVGGTYRVITGYESGQRPDDATGSLGNNFDTGFFGS